MEKNRFIELIEKYLSGSATDTERKLAEEYLEKMDSTAADSLDEEEEQDLKVAMWRKIESQTQNAPAKVVKISWYQKKFVRFAAGLAAACIIVIFFVQPWRKTTTHEQYQTVSVAQNSPIEKIKLADGTLAWLKPNSSLKYPKSFTGGQRKIDLNGEALFEVAIDSLHSFIVHSNDVDVRVVGTSFNVKGTSGDQRTLEVAVLTGKVWVSPPARFNSDKIELTPYYKLMIREKEGVLQKEQFASADLYMQGTEYDMRFVNTPLDNILSKIEKKFDVVIIKDNLTKIDCRVNGDFTDRSLQLTIDVLCKSVGAAYSYNKDTIKLSNFNCK